MPNMIHTLFIVGIRTLPQPTGYFGFVGVPASPQPTGASAYNWLNNDKPCTRT